MCIRDREDNGVVLAQVSLQPGASLEESTKVLYEVSKVIHQFPEVESVTEFAGFGLMSGVGSSYATLIVQLKPWSERPSKMNSSAAVQQRIKMCIRDRYNLSST